MDLGPSWGDWLPEERDGLIMNPWDLRTREQLARGCWQELLLTSLEFHFGTPLVLENGLQTGAAAAAAAAAAAKETGYSPQSQELKRAQQSSPLGDSKKCSCLRTTCLYQNPEGTQQKRVCILPSLGQE